MTYIFTIPYFTWVFPILFVFSFSRNSPMRELTEGYNKSTFRIQTFPPYNHDYFLTIKAVFFSAIEAYIDELILPLTGQFKRISYMRTSKISGVFNGIRSHDLCDARQKRFTNIPLFIIPFTGTHVPNKLICANLRGFTAQLVKALHQGSKGSCVQIPLEITENFKVHMGQQFLKKIQ